MTRLVQVVVPAAFSSAILKAALGSDLSVELHRGKMSDQRKSQSVPVAVAPDTALEVTRNGQRTMLYPGNEVLQNDMVAGSPARVVLGKLVEYDAVISLDQAELNARKTPAEVRFVVAPGGSITCKNGILDEGLEAKAELFERGQVDLDDFVRRGVVVDRMAAPQAWSSP